MVEICINCVGDGIVAGDGSQCFRCDHGDGDGDGDDVSACVGASAFVDRFNLWLEATGQRSRGCPELFLLYQL